MTARKPPKPKKNGKRQHREELLHEALDESFPASDPPAIVEPHGRPGEGED